MKKVKTTTRDERTTFSFIKNKIFQSNDSKQWSINNTDDTSISEFNTLSSSSSSTTNKLARPFSMLAMESLFDVKSEVYRNNNRRSLDVIEKRASLIILKEGYLYKKTDFKPFHKSKDRGWKLYRVILRGHKLYLYKVNYETPLKSLFPTSSSSASLSFSLSSSSIASHVTMKLVPSDFDSEAQKIFTLQAQGAIFTELNQVTLQPKQQVYLVICNEILYICTKSDAVWNIDHLISMNQLKLDYFVQTPTSSISMHSDSSGPLLFNILYINQPSTLGIYSTHHPEVAHTWINLFQNVTNHKDDNSNSNQTPLGSTLQTLIHHLLYNTDPKFIHVFLLTYTLYTTGSRVLSELKSHLSATIETRLVEIFTIWCTHFSIDVIGDVATGMIEILDLIHLDDIEKTKELVLNTVNENVEKTCELPNHIVSNTMMHEEEVIDNEELENIPAYIIDGKRRDSINLSNLLITGLTPDVFLQIDPLSFAQQIYLFHYSKHKQFRKDLLNPISYLPRPQLSVQMVNSLLFTTIAPHFLTKIIRNQILTDTEIEICVRSKLLEHWIRVGTCLIELGDMTGWCAVALGICSVGIIRLRETWKVVDRDLVNRVQSDWVRILSDYGLFAQDIWAEEWSYLDSTKVLSTPSTQSLPFFGTIRQFTDRYRKHAKNQIGPNTIHFEECERLYDTITSSLSTIEEFDIQVSIVAVGPLQSFFEHSITEMMSVPHDYKYLQECSISCEPRIFGQGFNRPINNSTDVVPPSSSCLTFPIILESPQTLTLNQGSKSSRRRTSSFPFGSPKIVDLEAENSKTWLGSFMSNRTKPFIDVNKNNSSDISFNINEELILIPLSESKDVLIVSVKAGYLGKLVDLLVYGILSIEDIIKEQWSMLTFNDYQPQKIVMDQEEFIHVFFTTFRTFCSSSHLLDMLRKRFLDAKLKCKLLVRKKSALNIQDYFDQENKIYDWNKIAEIQLNIMNIILYWIKEHPYDFMDEIQMTRYMSSFLRNAKESVISWTTLLKEDHEALEIAHSIHQRIHQVREQVIQKSMYPCYDMKTHEFNPVISSGIHDMYQKLTSRKQHYHVSFQLVSNSPVPVSFVDQTSDTKSVVDTCTSEALLKQVDQCVHQLFRAVTVQDWIQTLDVFESQTKDIYAWLPASRPSRTSRITSSLSTLTDGPYHSSSGMPDEVVVSDIFFAIQNARRSVVLPSTFSDDDLLLAFPGSIQYLYCMHFIIRSWVIQEISSMEIDSKVRVLRIEKFLQMILASKMTGISGFVEYAVASALVSPEVRLFTRAWHDVAIQHGHASLEDLEHLIKQIQRIQFQITSSAPQNLIPSIGWLFENMIEQCIDATDHKEDLIQFDKKRTIYELLQSMIHINIQEQETMAFSLLPNKQPTTWKDLKDFALQENKAINTTSNSLGLRNKSNRQIVFNRLVSEQMEKIKKDLKEKDRIDKDWLNLQQKLQKKQIEQARLVEKKSQQVKPRKRSILRGMTRPNSSLSQQEYTENDISLLKACTVINLIHSTTSVASTYTKRDFVFRIVTEEGGQYLFQGINRNDMNDWIQYIMNSAKEGAAKRQSVLLNESMDTPLVVDRTTRSHHRMSVYGVSLEELMPDGKKIPMIVEKCIQEIEKRGLEEVGIYRVAGTGSVVSALKAAFNKDVNKVNLSDPEWADINVVADALKQFLRELPEPLLTYTYYDELITASASEDHDQRVYLIKKVIKKLPFVNYTLLKRVVGHFVIVTDFEATNHMYATNIAIVFGPTLLQPTPGPASFATTMSNLGHHQNLVKYLILNYHYLFDIESEEKQ